MLRRTLNFIGLPLLLIGVWFVVTLGPTNFYTPQPLQILPTFWNTWVGDRFWHDVVPSLTRLAIGLVIAILFGITLGVVIGSTRWLRQLFEPLLEFFRAIPPPVLVPLLLLIIGVNDQMKIVVIVSGAVWPVLLNTVEGVRGVDPVLSDTCRSYGIRGWARVRYFVLPEASPQIMTGVRQSLSIGLILMVISEMFASSSGLGFTIVQFQRNFAIPEMWTGILLLGLIGLGLAMIFHFVEQRVLRWYHGLKDALHDN